ncbi:MAG: hypothetical protein EOP06_00230 [Proteobacteria bacterium]|nr:MAG: hypothetical protein EOP06_00230 [Pseudomonadota bacterium]
MSGKATPTSAITFSLTSFVRQSKSLRRSAKLESSAKEPLPEAKREVASSDGRQVMKLESGVETSQHFGIPASAASLTQSNQDGSRSSVFWLWVGTGANLQVYRQTLSSFKGQAEFQNIKGPTFLARGGLQGEKFGLDIAYKSSPGSVKSAGDVSVIAGVYQWRTLSVEGLCRLGSAHDARIRLGVQHHGMPFIRLDPAQSTITVEENTLSLFTLGLEKEFRVTPKLRSELLLRYQHPFSSSAGVGAAFDVSPRFAFDGSIGGVYNLTEHARIGLYWYGQFHSYGFQYRDRNESYSGRQQLFYSNIEARIGLEF